ncbi:MAG TPA: response regulator transcription factor, partial [Acidimicrobiales bacterium]|nr:response regulator transcription factor [Acidimicrobiales bacterium]
AALRLAMDMSGGFNVVAEAADGRQAVELAARHQPDLVVLDLIMPGGGGLEALPAIRSVAPDTGVVLLTAFDPTDVPDQAAAQTVGLLDKTADLDSLVDRLSRLATQR